MFRRLLIIFSCSGCRVYYFTELARHLSYDGIRTTIFACSAPKVKNNKAKTYVVIWIELNSESILESRID